MVLRRPRPRPARQNVGRSVPPALAICLSFPIGYFMQRRTRSHSHAASIPRCCCHLCCRLCCGGLTRTHSAYNLADDPELYADVRTRSSQPHTSHGPSLRSERHPGAGVPEWCPKRVLLAACARARRIHLGASARRFACCARRLRAVRNARSVPCRVMRARGQATCYSRAVVVDRRRGRPEAEDRGAWE